MARGGARILLVDDEQAVQTLLTYPLRKEGYEVVTAGDGQDALDRFGEQRFDLVVLDIMLPKLDGIEVCRRMRTRSQVPIIMLTAKGDEIDKVVGLEMGADDYITKPFSVREFRSRVKAALRRGRMAGSDETPGADPGRRARDRLRAPRDQDPRRGRPSSPTSSSRSSPRWRPTPGGSRAGETLLEHVWGDSDLPRPAHGRRPHPPPAREDRARPADPEYLFTVRGVGYRFREERAARCMAQLRLNTSGTAWCC